MLVLQRKSRERVLCEWPGGARLWVWWYYGPRGEIRLAFDGPRDEVRIAREEILDGEEARAP